LTSPDGSGSPAETGAAPRSGAGSSLTDRVYHELAERIARGEYGAEERLPSEHDLARSFGVSRPVIRLALGRLREEGLIYSRQGAGSFVHAARQAAQSRHNVLGFTPIETIADIQRCFEFRLTIEPDAAFHAAQRRSDADLDVIRSAIRGLEEATRGLQHRDDVDFIFHRAIAQASSNHYYVTAFTALHGHIAVGMKLHGLSLMNARPKLELVFQEHLAIFQAVRDRQPDAAEAAMRAHLEGSRDRLFEGRLLDLSSRDTG
jgi:GntR family transcriptional repressor for pyruvate dehydrogenase complex